MNPSLSLCLVCVCVCVCCKGRLHPRLNTHHEMCQEVVILAQLLQAFTICQSHSQFLCMQLWLDRYEDYQITIFWRSISPLGPGKNYLHFLSLLVCVRVSVCLMCVGTRLKACLCNASLRNYVDQIYLKHKQNLGSLICSNQVQCTVQVYCRYKAQYLRLLNHGEMN